MQLLHQFVIFQNLGNFANFQVSIIFQMILPVLITPNNYYFQDQVIPPSNRLWMFNKTFTKLDMVYSDFIVSAPDMVSVLILDLQKYGVHL